MREVKREYTTTTYAVMEYKGGNVEEIGKIILEGNENMEKARKEAMKQFPERNICIGESKTESAVYTMPAQDFIKNAHKETV